MKKHLLYLLLAPLFLLNPLPCAAQIITTVAGNGGWTYNGDGEQATDAALYSPYMTATDDSGNLYIADAINNRVRKVNAAGIISTFAGTGYMSASYTGSYSGDGGPADSADLYWPECIAIDKAGNMYIADAGNNRIRKINAAGIISTYAGSDSGGYGGDGGPATAARLHYPDWVALDTSGNVYITDGFNNRVRKVDTAGIITTVAGNGYGDTSYTGGYGGDGGPADSAELHWPAGITLDRSGNLYIADAFNNCVREVTAAGIITTIAGNDTVAGYNGDGIPATSARLCAPSAVLTDMAGNLYIGDGGNDRIRIITPDGMIQTFAGSGLFGFSGDGGPCTDADMVSPNGMAFDATGGMYVADQGNYRIRYITAVPNTVKNTGGGYKLDVFPNPATGLFTVSFPGHAAPLTLTLSDLYGRVVCEQTIGASVPIATFNITGSQPGMYLLKASSADFTDTRKVILQ